MTMGFHPTERDRPPLFEQQRAEIERLRAANEKLGFWMSAALEDPEVCEEMKADIRAWFEAQAYDAERS